MPKLIVRGLIALGACCLISACGGGGTSGSPSGGGNPTPTTTTISGVASKGLLRNAIVTLYGVTGGRIDATSLATTRTDASGRFSVSLAYTGALVAVLTVDASTTMLDEISGADLAAPANLTLHAVMSSLPSQPVAITPLTEVAWDLAGAATGGLTAQNIDNANSAVGAALLGGAPVLTTAPITLEQYATATAAQQAQAKLLTALAIAANRGTATGANGQACAAGSYGANLLCMIDGLDGLLVAAGSSAALTSRATYVADTYALIDQGQVTVNGGRSTSSLGLTAATTAQTSLTLCVQLYTCSAGGSSSGLTAITTPLSWDGAQASWDTALWQ